MLALDLCIITLYLAACFLKTHVMPKTCPQCQTTFDCAGCSTGVCWCMDYPPILSCAAADDCLCPACLTAVCAARIAETIDDRAVHESAPAAALACQGQPLIEGLDYTIDNGLWVLSRWYLLKRGECCGNGCCNCPFGHANVKS